MPMVACIYVHEDLCAVDVISDQLNDSEIEQIWCEVILNEEIILIGCIYRPYDKLDEKICKSLVEARNHLLETPGCMN